MNLPAIVKPCEPNVFQQDNIHCVYDPSTIATFDPEMLSPFYWQSRQAIVGSAQGRGTTWFIKHQHQQWVLRHYYRGGLIGKCIRDRYWFTTLAATRAAQEFTLLLTLQALNLPAPRPIAYRVIRTGWLYQADLLTSRINGATDLATMLCQQNVSEQLWQKIGATIKRFHAQGIYHHDLNCHNILLDHQHNVWLIDFDRGEQRQPDRRWQQQNLDRLLRSFTKENAQLPQFYWRSQDWEILLHGYDSVQD